MDYLSVQDLCFVGKSGGCIGKYLEGEGKRERKSSVGVNFLIRFV
jgi:hypothetical protein